METTNITKDFSTESLEGEALKVANIVIGVLTSYFPQDWTISGGGSKAFYSPEEWKDRGERHGNGAELIVVYDGGDLGGFFNYSKENEEAIVAMDAAFSKAGYMAEPINHWSAAIYKD